jgi:hypothetical protein
MDYNNILMGIRSNTWLAEMKFDLRSGFDPIPSEQKRVRTPS